jgi:ATP-dependent DNA helicase DinG
MEIAGPTGPLACNLKGYEPRLQQHQMMSDVANAFNKQAVALIEAGTGTGKSIAYLLPVMMWVSKHKQRTLLSTHTISLQEQLIEKDIPELIQALGLDIKAVLVKGMGNYACFRKIEESHMDLLLMDSEERAQFVQIEAWAEKSHDGSKASLPFVPSSTCWERVGAESDTCTTTKCPHYQKCFFFKARRHAEDAQLLIANHHLLFADLSLRAEKNNYDETTILPSYEHIIIDEAHHIEDVATEFFGARTSKLAINRTIKRLMTEKQGKAVGKLPLLREKLHECSPPNPSFETGKILARLINDIPGNARNIQIHSNNTFDLLAKFIDDAATNDDESESKLRLQPHQYEKPFWLKEIVPAAKTLVSSVKSYVQSIIALEEDCKELKNERFQEQSKTIRSDITAFIGRIAEQASLIDQMILSPPPAERVRWIETNKLRMGSNVSLISAPLDISQLLAKALFSPFKTVILCSATLTTNRQFNFIRSRLGITETLLENKTIIESIYDAPFDYPKQSLLVIPTDIPEPSNKNFTEAASEQIWRAVEVSRGSSFVLFTSYGMMQKCHELLAERLEKNRYKLFKQGDANRQALLTQFKNTSRGVLFGTDSFWEGVDVAGEALRCVVIVKLPFRVPSEPIIQARTEAIEAQGGDPFMDYTLPTAIVKFKQGFGRLIRNRRDRGCIVCLDTRLISKNYGKLFLNSLPDCQRCITTSVEIEKEMRAFYRRTHHLIIQ